jgi:Peptidase M15
MATRKRLSPHFRVEEFDCHDGTQIPEEWYDDFIRWCVWWGEPLRAEFGAVRVVSGYRTVSHNARVGGARQSVHLLKTPLPEGERRPRPGDRHGPPQLAVAADVMPARGNPQAWASWAKRFRAAHRHLGPRGRGGIGLYVASGFVHLDTGPARVWHG